MNKSKIGFIGAGNMAAAMIGGLIQQGISAENIWASDLNGEALSGLQQQYGIHTSQDNAELIASSDVVILAVKPQVLKQVLEPLKAVIYERQPLLISIAAGINLHSLQSWSGTDTAIVRCMPNTPALVQSAATALFANVSVSVEQKQLAEHLLASIGLVVWVEAEAQLDAVTAVSGSGPAYFFLVMEAMIEAGEQLGLSSELASRLTLQTALGAAKMASSSEVDAAELRRRVTSPGGTTAAALNEFEHAGLVAMFKTALQAAHKRSETLAQELGS